ncbi:MAG: response regulator [Prolixibacteraceae bacterium]|nr:response regulator [Prolixibacteraceae bacterium]
MLYLFFIFILISNCLLAEKRQNTFTSLTINDGLSYNTVNCILKDSSGFMWFGTNDGLNKYDGYNFTVYKYNPEDSMSISDNRVYDIEMDEKGNLWIGTRNGLNMYNPELDNFKRFRLNLPADSGNSVNDFVRDILVDDDGQVWLGTLGKGLLRFNPANNKFESFSSLPDEFVLSKGGSDVSSVYRDSKGRLWITNNTHGLNLLDTTSRDVKFYPFEHGVIETDNIGKTIYEDKSGNIWVCTEGKGLYRFHEPENTFTHYGINESENTLSNNVVKDIYQDDEGRYWIATDGGGLEVYDLSNREYFTYNYDISIDNSLSSDGIYCIYGDDTDIIWIGTFGGGVNILDNNRKKFSHYTQTGKTNNELSHPSVLSFEEDEDGMIWIGTDGGGINLFDPGQQAFTHYKCTPENTSTIGSNVVTDIYQDSEGLLWFGTYGGGVNLFDEKSGAFVRFKSDPYDSMSISNNNVWSVYEDTHKSFWVGTLDGLEEFDKKSNTFSIVELPGVDQLYSEKVTIILQDSYGQLWFGGALLTSMDMTTGAFTLYDDKAVKEYDVRTIFEDSKGVLWIGTEGGGLSRFERDKNTFVNYDINDGLPSNAVHAILEDDNGFLWISTNKGLSKFDKEEEVFRNYDVHDGLQSNQFSYNAALKSSRGYMYFGGVNGFNSFWPDSIRNNPYPPPVVFTDFRLKNKNVIIGAKNSPLKKHINETEKIILAHHESVFTIEFAALNFTSPGKNQYAYMMEGFDNDWNYVGEQRTATYTNLDEGEYVFKLKASNNDGVWNEQTASIEFEILPPWWRTLWAYMGYAFVMVAFLMGFRNYLVRQQELKNALIMKDVERKKIEELNQMKLKFYTNISHEFRTPLTLIYGPLEKLMQMYKENDTVYNYLNLMRRNTLRLSRLINQIMDFRKIETGNMKLKISEADVVTFISDIKEHFDSYANDRGISFTFKTNVEILNVKLDYDKMDMVFYNLLSNAFKFTPDNGSICINIDAHNSDDELHNDFFKITVKDSGVGISAERLTNIFDRFYQIDEPSQFIKAASRNGTGIGLSLTKELVELHGGSISVESEKNVGSTFDILLPLKDDWIYNEKNIEIKGETENKLNPQAFGLDEKQLVFDNGIYDEENEGVELKKDQPLVLVIDDDGDMRSFVKDSLCSDFEVITAGNGEKGYEKTQKYIPDMIICDVMMPVMGGFEMAAKVRENDKISHIPIIFLSAIGTIENNLLGFGFGAYDYITKPFNVSVLNAKVKSVIENRKKLQEKMRKEFIMTPHTVTVSSPEEKFLKKAIEIVEKNIANSDFDVKVFYTQMGLSRSVLYRKLEAVTGQTVNDFVRSIRLKKAAGYLKQNILTVSEVSYEVGFNDPQYFSKCFRKAFGKSPSAYAREYTEE